MQSKMDPTHIHQQDIPSASAENESPTSMVYDRAFLLNQPIDRSIRARACATCSCRREKTDAYPKQCTRDIEEDEVEQFFFFVTGTGTANSRTWTKHPKRPFEFEEGLSVREVRACTMKKESRIRIVAYIM